MNHNRVVIRNHRQAESTILVIYILFVDLTSQSFCAKLSTRNHYMHNMSIIGIAYDRPKVAEIQLTRKEINVIDYIVWRVIHFSQPSNCLSLPSSC